jgi:FkbH-like protein
MVFVDDSDFEVNLIRETLPEVLAIYPFQLMTTVLEYFDLSGDLTKTQQYKENYQRTKAKEQFTNIDEYLTSLDMILTIKLNEGAHIKRIAELTNKTNQFNLTTLRYTQEDIVDMMSWCYIYSLSVKDKFGDSGITGVCIIKANRIDAFLLSCRILGRNIEYAFLDYVINHVKNFGYQALMASYSPTAKNKQTEKFYANIGFECIDVSDERTWFSLIFENYKYKPPQYFKYE